MQDSTGGSQSVGGETGTMPLIPIHHHTKKITEFTDELCIEAAVEGD